MLLWVAPIHPSALGQSVSTITKNYADQAEAFQHSLLFGKEYCGEKNMLFEGGNKLKRQFKVKYYDRKNWVIEISADGRVVTSGSNDHYAFHVERLKTGRWKQLGIPGPHPTPEEIKKHFAIEYDIINPLIFLMGYPLIDEFKDAENTTIKSHTKGDLDVLQFDFFDKRFKEKGYGPVQVQFEFRNSPFPNIVLYEKVLKKYPMEIFFRSYRTIRMGGSGNLESITVANEGKNLANNRVLQREEYLLKDFKPVQKLRDNYLSFYGFAEPSHLTKGKAWFDSYWFIGGCLLAICGVTGLWVYRKPASQGPRS